MATWVERLRSTLAGEVRSDDIVAFLGAMKPLEDVHRQVDDARLSAKIAGEREDWQTALTWGRVMAPLWLADQLVTIVQSLSEGEAAYHRGQSAILSAASHALAVAILEPLETLIAEVSAALADPQHPLRLSLPWRAGPDGEVAHLPLPIPLPPGYLRGLLLAAERIQSATAVLLVDVKALGHSAGAPPWLIEGVQRVEGELAAARARQTMLDARLSPLLAGDNPALPEEASIKTMGMDLWSVLNTILVSGQLLADPHLLPGAPVASPSFADRAMRHAEVTSSTTRPQSRPVDQPAPVPPVRPSVPASQPKTPPPEQVRELPDIQTELTLPERTRKRSVPTEDSALSLPEIGEGAAEDQGGPSVRELPEIGPGT